MSYEDSPSLDQFKEGIPPRLPDPNSARRRMRITIGFLAILLLGLALANFFQSHAATFIVGEGTVRGIILDNEGNPVPAAITVEHTKLETNSDQNGYFEIRGIPVGNQTIVITWMFAGHEAPIEIHRGGITDLGTIYVPTDQRPDHPLPRLEWR